MTKDTNQENAQRVITYLQDNVEGLKELSRGCKIESCKHAKYYPDFGECTLLQKEWRDSGFFIDRDNGLGDLQTLRAIDILEDFKIIGKEPQLRHLLLAMKAKLNNALVFSVNSLWIDIYNPYTKEIKFSQFYDLRTTVQENLKSNPELCQYLLELFQLTTNN